MTVFLANLIKIFHILVILFVILTPIIFFSYHSLLILHIAFSICLLIHWVNNSNMCSLTLLESKLRGNMQYNKTFIHQFISPIYDISKKESNEIIYAMTILLMFLSIYHLYYSNSFNAIIQNIRNLNTENLSWSESFKLYMMNFVKLFQL